MKNKKLIFKNNKIKIIKEKNNYIVYLNNKIFLKQPIIKSESEDNNFFLVLFLINRFGLLNNIDY